MPFDPNLPFASVETAGGFQCNLQTGAFWSKYPPYGSVTLPAGYLDPSAIPVRWADAAGTLIVRPDGTFASIGGGSGTWGAIAGTLSNQADLQAALNAKAGTAVFTNVAAGIVPASGGGTTNFLRADGSFAVPGGGAGTVTSVSGAGGTTGLTLAGGPITASGTLTLGGTLAVASGGTGTATPAIVAGTNITVSGSWPNQTVNAAGGAGLNMTPDVVAATTYTMVAGDNGKNKVFTNAAGCVITVNTALGVGFFAFISKSAAAGVLTFNGTATITSDSGSTTVSANSAVCLLVPTNTDVYDLQGPTGPVVGASIDLNPVDIAATRALTAADFGTGIVRLNSSSSAIALTLPTVAAMALSATAGKVRTIIFEVIGTIIPTFAGATASTSINGVAGATTVLPLGGAPVQYGLYMLTQTAVGSDSWSLM